MLIHLNGWPGVGKFTVGRLLQFKIGGHLLDNHSIYNVAFNLTEFRSPEFYATVRAVREVAFARVAHLPAQTPVIMTNGLNDGAWGQENWAAIRQLADQWGSPLFSVILTCDPQEHGRRMASPERRYLGKLTDLEKWQPRSKILLGEDADFCLQLDTSITPPEATAERICVWLKSAPQRSLGAQNADF
jgi:hypothetical protein